jgi:hypothetical protein
MNTEMTTQLRNGHILNKVIWEAMLHVFCVQWNDYKQAHPHKLQRTLSQIQHCLIKRQFIIHNTLKHCSKAFMI